MSHWDSCQYPLFTLLRSLTFITASGDARSTEGPWEKLAQVAIKGAVYDSPERQPHPKCLKGTRVKFLEYIYRSLDTPGKSQLVWVHGTAGVGKSAVAFTVAERMRGMRMEKQTSSEKRLAGTFFFSRKHTKRCTTGYFFATLAYQLARNFSCIKGDLIATIREDPAILDPETSLRNQMEELFLGPLRRLQLRLQECLPLVFVIDALDECTSETEVTDLVTLLGQALREPDLPAIHILITSRPEAHIYEAIHEEEVYPLVHEIPVKIWRGYRFLNLIRRYRRRRGYIYIPESFVHKAPTSLPRFPTADGGSTCATGGSSRQTFHRSIHDDKFHR